MIDGGIGTASARMIPRGHIANIISLGCIPLCLIACAARLSRTYFEVLPNSPDYLLQSPDSRRTPFPEVLKAYNGFEAGHAWVDLEPLMELRIENAYYEPGGPRTGLAGFLGTEVARYLVASHGLHLLSVQPMANRPNDQIPVQDLISHSETKFSHYRLYYEVVFARRHNSHGSVLLGADSQAEMDALSAQLAHPEEVCSQRSTHCIIFPEACSVSVEMQVIVNSKPESVLWGVTLESIAKQPRHLEMKRLYAGELRPVRIDANDPKSLLLPLLPGDRITWN
ncbi:MAG: hypothetical protein JO138_07180 [Acidobacteriaceae bacterium]|nr:hypothetical protein [Acidobacteriaceae bacterium]